MTDDPLGVVSREGDTCTIRFERRLRHPVAKVWAALTDPERIADWFCRMTIEPHAGGAVTLDFAGENYRVTGTVVEYAPPRCIAWRWPDPQHPDSIVRFTLAADGDGCRLTLTQSGLAPDRVVAPLAGWHTYLEALPRALEGSRTPWRRDREAEWLAQYRARASVSMDWGVNHTSDEQQPDAMRV